MKKTLMLLAVGAAVAATAAPLFQNKQRAISQANHRHASVPGRASVQRQQAVAQHQQKAAMQQQKAAAQMMHQQQKAAMHQQKAAAHMMHQQQKAVMHQQKQQAHMVHQMAKAQARAIRAGGRAAMRGPRFSNGHHIPPPSFDGWYRGPRPHAHFRNVWMDDIWYDAYGYPCYSPYYMEVVEVPGAVLYTPGAVVAPTPVVAPAPAVVAPAPAVVVPPPVVTPAPTVVVPGPPRTRAGAIVDALLAP